MNLLFGHMLTLLVLFAGPVSHEDVRMAFHSSIESEEDLDFFIQNQGFPNTGLTKAYKGLSWAMMAEHSFLPHTKYNRFTTGRNMVEEAIKDDPLNAELRYVRLMIQLNAPAFLGYNSNVEEDMELLINAMEGDLYTEKWKRTFAVNLLAAGKISTSNRSALMKYL